MKRLFFFVIVSLLACLVAVGCISDPPAGLAPSQPAATTVLFDFEAKPLPEIPLPNDVATRYDKTSPTGRRINASKIAPTHFEALARQRTGQEIAVGRIARVCQQGVMHHQHGRHRQDGHDGRCHHEQQHEGKHVSDEGDGRMRALSEM